MIQTQTKLKVIDNSGAKLSQCIKVLGGYKKRTAKVGDTIVVSIKKIKTNTTSKTKSKIKKGSVNKAIVLRTKKWTSRKDGSSIRFSENSVLTLNAQNQPIGTRILGVIPNELKRYKGARITSLASGIL